MCGATPSFPQYAFMEWSSVKRRGNFVFTVKIQDLFQEQYSIHESTEDPRLLGIC